MKYGWDKRKGISLLLALVMLCSIIAELARPAAYAADLTELDGAAETEESAELPEDGGSGEDTAPEEPSEEPGAEEEQTAEDPSEASEDQPGEEPSDETPEDGLTEPEENETIADEPVSDEPIPDEAALDQPEELPSIEEITLEEQLLGMGPMKAAGSSAYTIYFAVPSNWSSYDKFVFNARKGDSDNDGWVNKEMEDTGLTYLGQPIYSVELSTEECPHGMFHPIQFLAYQNGAYKAEIKIDGQTFSSSFNGKIYYNNGWVEYKPDGHDKYAGQSMAFENKSGETLSEVKYVFYEMEENGVTLTQVGQVLIGERSG